jgi:hypothetical protein
MMRRSEIRLEHALRGPTTCLTRRPSGHRDALTCRGADDPSHGVPVSPALEAHRARLVSELGMNKCAGPDQLA